jgi:hypothetical protein
MSILHGFDIVVLSTGAFQSGVVVVCGVFSEVFFSVFSEVFMIDEASVLGWHELKQLQGRAEYLSLLALLAG